MKYIVTMVVDTTKVVEVEAHSKEEAEEKAWEESNISLCHRCTSELNVGDVTEILSVEEVKE